MSPTKPWDALVNNLQERVEQQKANTRLAPMLNTLKEIVMAVDDEQRDPLLNQLNAAIRRYNDDKLNLAIIGEFSCGKSTFINALFQKEILSTDMQPTTAVPTYITWTNRQASAKSSNYAVTVHTNDQRIFNLSDENDKKRFQRSFHIKLPENPDSIIDAVTTDNTLGRLIEKVEVAVPYNATYQNIRLIDTPGVNPGIHGTEEHIHATQNVLRESADAAIIMFPCDQVYTASFNNFLRDNASHLLRNSIFVLTKCDLIRSDQEKLVDFVALHLKKLGVASPQIYCISASYALDAYLSTTTLTSKEAKWKASFENTIQSIFTDMASRRTRIVYENITHVVSEMTTLLTTELNAEQEAVKYVRNDLETLSPENMRKDCEAITASYISKLKAKKTKWDVEANNLVTAGIEKRKNTYYRIVDNCKTNTKVQEALRHFSSNAGKYIENDISSYTEKVSESLNEIFSEYKKELDECYSKYHLAISTTKANLSRVDKENVPESNPLHINPFIGLRPPTDVFVPLPMAIAVTMLVLNLYEMLRPLNSAKQAAKSKINNALAQIKEPAIKNLHTNISSLYDTCLKNVEALPAQMLEIFHTEFEEAKSSFQWKADYMDAKIETLGKHLSNLRAISAQLA